MGRFGEEEAGPSAGYLIKYMSSGESKKKEEGDT